MLGVNRCFIPFLVCIMLQFLQYTVCSCTAFLWHPQQAPFATQIFGCYVYFSGWLTPSSAFLLWFLQSESSEALAILNDWSCMCSCHKFSMGAGVKKFPHFSTLCIETMGGGSQVHGTSVGPGTPHLGGDRVLPTQQTTSCIALSMAVCTHHASLVTSSSHPHHHSCQH